MIIKNKTNQIQEISVMNRDNTSLTYTIYIKAKSELEVDDSLIVVNLKNLVSRGILGVGNTVVPVLPVIELPEEEILVPEETITEDIVEDAVEEVIMEFPELEEETTPVVDESTDQILCDVCGKEFASQRSLTMHMNKSHKE